MRDFLFVNGGEADYFGFRENAEAFGPAALFGVRTHKLHPDANAQDRLLQGAYHIVQTGFAKVVHCYSRLALAGYYYMVCLRQLRNVIGNNAIRTQPCKGGFYGKYVSGGIFQNGSGHLFEVVLIILRIVHANIANISIPRLAGTSKQGGKKGGP